jgi:excisionase family DNA binding protein
MQATAPAYVSAAQFAAATSLGLRTIHRLVAADQIPSIRVGGRRLIPLREALAALPQLSSATEQ